MPENVELKPCPFCGHAALDWALKILHKKPEEDRKGLVWVECLVCGAKTRAFVFTLGHDVEINQAFDKADRAWNRRAKSED